MTDTPDGTPEDIDREFRDFDALKKEADAIDLYRYRRRNRALAAIGIGALAAGLVYVVLEAVDQARNPCARVRDYYCKQDPQGLKCKNYAGVYEESVDPNAPEARGSIRHQCATHIKRVLIDDGVKIP